MGAVTRMTCGWAMLWTFGGWKVEPGRLIRLRAEMKVPGRAWLEFQALPQAGGQTLLSQTAFFEPKGLLGLLYWYVLYPIHSLIFSGLIRRIALQVSSKV